MRGIRKEWGSVALSIFLSNSSLISFRNFYLKWLSATEPFKVGGYAVCEKWLKDRKGRQLDFADIQHYGAVVAALTRTRELMQEIDVVVNGQLWPEAVGSL